MLKNIMHIGVTVSDMDRSIAFYRDVLGLRWVGELTMQDKATDRLFARQGVKARVAYLQGTDEIAGPPVELICFCDEAGKDQKKAPAELTRVGISEICFEVADIDAVYQRLIQSGVQCLSEPQFFDFSADGFSRSKAIYFRDPDGIILELMQPLP